LTASSEESERRLSTVRDGSGRPPVEWAERVFDPNRGDNAIFAVDQ